MAATIVELAASLSAAGRAAEGGWLLVAFVEPEGRRRALVGPATVALLARARESLASAGLSAAAAEVAAMTQRGGGVCTACTPEAVKAGAKAALDALAGRWTPTQRVNMYAFLGLVTDAARVAERLHLHREAAELWQRANRPFEAARAWVVAEEPARAVTALAQVDRTDERYRRAATAAARLAERSDRLDFALDHFLAGFAATPPEHPGEEDAMLALARLYARHGRQDEARRLVERVVAITPSRAGDPGLPSLAPSSLPVGLPEIEALPELPPLPLLPPLSPPLGAAPEGTLVPPAGAPPPTGRTTHLPALAPNGLAAATAVPEPRPADTPRSAPPAPRPGPPPPPAAAWQNLTPGTVVGDRYTVEAILGRGAMGAVVRAADHELGETVALKVMMAPADNATWSERLRRELRLTRMLTHPNVVRVHDIGTHGACRYISMEYLKGQDLRRKMNAGLTPEEIVDLLEQTAEGLEAAHRAGIVHRDVKPENIFVTDSGTVKVMDFGIARQEDLPTFTVAGVVAGTALYMAPEQAEGFSKAGPPADQYALGVVAYEMCALQTPFYHEELMALLLQHRLADPPPIAPSAPWVPPAMERQILRALAKDPQTRHASCRDFARAVRDAWTEAVIGR